MTRVAPSGRAYEGRRAVSFLADAPASDYGERLGRLRWHRAAAASESHEWKPADAAAARLAAAEEWVVVAVPAALPGGPIPRAPAGEILRSKPGALPSVHTLRELEASRIHPREGAAAAIAFRTADAAPHARGTCAELFAALASRARTAEGFVSVTIPDPSDAPRPEIARRVPEAAVRILDVGCGSAGALSALPRRGERRVTGIERDPRRAAAARRRCERVLEADLRDALDDLAAAGERFDAVVFADVLEHLEDPIAALAAGLRVGAPSGTLLVSVPNVGHLSIARDLLLGRFDPTPAGLCDAGHLRWFSRDFLEEAILEAGWSAPRIERERGADAPDPAAFRDLAAAWPDADRESLDTYQWIATAARPR